MTALASLTLDQLQSRFAVALNQPDRARAIGMIADECDRRDRYVPPAPVVGASPLGAAQWYASQGLAVFPLRPRSKIPLPGSHGCKDSTIDPAQIAAWWHRTPDANIGIATGLLVDVIDLDGWDGQDAWASLDGAPDWLGVVITPRRSGGGRHLYIPTSGEGNATGYMGLPKVDYRGAGGYVVAPPSVTDDGPYWWRHPLDMGRMA